MATTALVSKTKVAVYHFVVTRNGAGKITETPITQEEVDALKLPGAGPPAGVSADDWYSGKATVAADVPDYGGGQAFLANGEICELPDRFELGVYVKERDKTITIRIEKAKVDVSRAGGLTIEKSSADAWSEDFGITSITSGTLTTKD